MLAALLLATLGVGAQTNDGGGGDGAIDGRIIARIQDRTSDDGEDDYRIEFGFLPQWAMDEKDPWTEALTTFSDLLPRARYLNQATIEAREGADNQNWLRSSLVSVPAKGATQATGDDSDADFAGEEEGAAAGLSGRVIARYSPHSRTGALRIEFGFLPQWAFDRAGSTQAAVEQYGDEFLPTARYISESMIANRRDRWLRSSVITVTPPPPPPPGCEINVTSPVISLEQREAVEGTRIGTIECELSEEFDPVTISGLPGGLAIEDVGAGENVSRLILSGQVDADAEVRPYTVTIAARSQDDARVSEKLTIRVTRGGSEQDLAWNGYTPDTGPPGGRVRLLQPRVITGPSDPEWSYRSDTPRVCAVDRAGALTLTAEGQCQVTATSAAREGFREEAVQTVVTVTDKEIPDIRWDGYDALEVDVGGHPPIVRRPTATVDGRPVVLTYTFELHDDTERGVCEVNPRSGRLATLGAGDCVVIAKSVETDEHAAGESEPVRVMIIQTKQDPELRWDGYGAADLENLRAGGDPIGAIDPQPRLREARGQLTYVWSAWPSSVCIVNARSGELTPRGAGECEVTVRSEESDEFLTGEVMIVVDVRGGKERPDLDWFDYAGEPITVGGDPRMPTVPGSRDRVGPLTYRSETPNVCSVDRRTGQLSARERGTCRVTVESAETDELLEGSETITVPIGTKLPPTPCTLDYANDVTVGNLVRPNLDCGDGRPRYVSDTPNVCSVNRNSGDVTGLADGQCRITVATEETNRYAEGEAWATLRVNPDLPPDCESGGIGDVGPLEAGERSRSITVDDFGPCYDPEGERLRYSATPSDPDVATVRVSGSSLTVTGVAGGTATITVTAADPGGQTDTTTFRVTVEGDPAPEIEISCPSSANVDENITCTVSNSGGAIDSHNWSDSDGGSGSSPSYSPSFSTSGTKTVSLTARNTAGDDSDSASVEVAERPVINSISCTPSPVATNTNANCTANVSGTEPLTHSWSGGDSSGSSSAYSTSWNSEGAKTVSLTVRNSAGSDSDSTAVTVMTPPSISSLGCPSSATVNQAISCSPTVTGTEPLRYSWSGGESDSGQSGSTYSPSWSTTGNKTVSLTVTNAVGSDSDSANVGGGVPPPDPAISCTPSTVATNTSVSCEVSSNSGGVISTYAWSGGPSNGSGSSYSPSWSSAGSKTVSLTASNAGGSGSDSTSVTVMIPPSISSLGCPSSATVNQAISCSPTVTGTEPLTYSWSGGDSNSGRSGSTYSPSWSTDGNKTVSLTVTNDVGNDVDSTSVEVTEAVTQPVISISCSPSSANKGDSVTCSVSSNSGGAIDGYSWRASGGSPSSGSSSTYSPSFSTSGTKTVSLTARNSADSDSDSTSVSVVNRSPEHVGSISSITLDVDRSQTINVSGNFRDPDPNDRLTYDADSGSTSTARVSVSGSSVTVTGRRSGSTTITVTAEDPDRATVTQTFTVTVRVEPPVITVSCSPSSIDEGDRVRCTVSNSGGSIDSYSWSASGGSPSSGSSSSYRPRFNTAGTYTVSLTVSNTGGSDSDTYRSITVTAERPDISSIRCTAYVLQGNSASCSVRNRGGPISTYSWSGGDSSGSSSTYSPSWSSYGRKTVWLTASNAGGSDSDSLPVNVLATPPSSNYARCGSDNIRVYWFDRSNYSKHWLNMTGDEATTIFGSSWWNTIGHMSQGACNSWPTGRNLGPGDYN